MEPVTPTRDGYVHWAPEPAARYRELGYWSGRPLGDLVGDAARVRPDAVCVVDADVRLTFAELMARADGAALRLRALGVGADDRIVVQLPNCWEFVVLLVACLRLGAVPVLTLTAHRRTEITGILAHAEARALVVPGGDQEFDHAGMALAVAGGAPTLDHVVVPGGDPRGGLDLHDVLAPAADPVAAAAELDAHAPPASEVALFMLSGGTTGTPKAIPRTHDDLAYMMRTAAGVCAVDDRSSYLAVLPLGHGFPVTGPGVLGTLIAGGRVVLCPSPRPQNAFRLIAEEGVTVTSVVPAIVHRWLEHRGTDTIADLSSLRVLQVGGSRLPDDVAVRIGPVLGCTLQQVFGMSEGLLCMTRLADPATVACRSQGRPVCPDDEILVVDDDGAPVAPGEPGVLLTRGPYTPWSYYRPDERQATAHLPGGWYRTGDVVRELPGGDLVVEGREKDVINRGGEKIGADEVENLVRACAGIADAAAVAMPDPELGERVCVYVVPEHGAVVALAEVRAAMLAAGVAHIMMPDRLVAVATLPLTAVGKVDKVGLRGDIGARIVADAATGRAA